MTLTIIISAIIGILVYTLIVIALAFFGKDVFNLIATEEQNKKLNALDDEMEGIKK